MKRMPATKAPHGRLIKKHHRQLAYWVKEPPMKGPKIFAIFAKPTLMRNLKSALLNLEILRVVDGSGAELNSLKGRPCLTTSETPKTRDIVLK